MNCVPSVECVTKHKTICFISVHIPSLFGQNLRNPGLQYQNLDRNRRSTDFFQNLKGRSVGKKSPIFCIGFDYQ